MEIMCCMKSHVLPVGVRVILAISWLGGSGCGRVDDALSDTQAAAIRDSVAVALTQFRKYSAASQWDSLAGLYSRSSDFRFLENGAVEYRSADAILAALRGLPPGTEIRTSYDQTEVVAVGPGVAWVSATFATTFSDGTGLQFEYGGAVTLMWVHEPDGWRIMGGHSSSLVERGSD